ncbi:MAG: response regulator [Pseudorhodoplanes sp.]|nr:response regulator [Pseudorhodoplanes sp.]MCL4712771.1 response regulator [Pseudorhodoplanes sp.]MCZ7642378.1 response regulator [Pseudorhodoplanes sp.]GIK78983.1 MAG: hypothetical protein BroJett024_00880 [Alphaproteobacteria bacterium]
MSETSSNRVPAILLVEDEVLISDLVREALVEDGYAVHAVADAGEALQHLCGPAQVDVLFTDINLPGTMDGVALAARAREQNPSLAVVFASGRWGLLEKLAAFPHAIALRKPYSLAQACAAVQALLDAAASAPATKN